MGTLAATVAAAAAPPGLNAAILKFRCAEGPCCTVPCRAIRGQTGARHSFGPVACRRAINRTWW